METKTSQGIVQVVLKEVIEYNTSRWDFRKIVQDYLNYKNIESLHDLVDYGVFVRENDQSTVFHEKFYKMCDQSDKFDSLYREWIREFVSPYIQDDSLVFQKRPTFRVHLNGNKAVGEFHKDSNYNHPIEEINFFVPLTDSHETGTIWVENAPNTYVYRPVNLSYGQALVFRGGLLNHGNLINQTGKTRVSFDFRVIRSTDYSENGYESVNSSRKFIIGDYYDCL